MDIIDLLLGIESGGMFPPFIPARVANANTTWPDVRPDVKIDSRALSARRQGLPEESADDIDFPVLRDFEDRRLWNPEGEAALPRLNSDRSGRLVPRGSSRWGSLPSRVGFDNPSLVLVCARRMARRQVMMAHGFRGRLGYSRSRRNSFSGVSCRGF